MEIDQNDEDKGTALASYGLVTGTIRILRSKGILDDQDTTNLLTGLLSSLEQSDLVSDPAVHSARVLLSAFAQELDIPLRRGN